MFTDADHSKLNGISANANNYSHPDHTGEVTSSSDGATTLTVSAITNRTALTTGIVDADELLINDSGALKRTDVSVLGGYMQSSLDHDSFQGFVANEHIDWTADQGATDINAGNISESSVTQHEGALSIAYTQLDTEVAKRVFSTSNTSNTNSGDWTKVARITITNRYGDCNAVIKAMSFSESQAEISFSEIHLGVKQQADFGSNPNIELTQYHEDGVRYFDASYVIVQNTPSTIVDVYLQVTRTYTRVRGWTMLQQTGSGSFTWYSSNGWETTEPTGNVVADIHQYFHEGHPPTATEIVSGQFADAQISESSVTQHEAALAVNVSQLNADANLNLGANQLTASQVNVGGITITSDSIQGPNTSDYLLFDHDVDGIFSWGTTDNAIVTQSTTNMAFVGDSNSNGTGGNFDWGYGDSASSFTRNMTLNRAGNLSVLNGGIYTNSVERLTNGGVLTNVTADAAIITSGTFADARISESSVTQHQAALLDSVSGTFTVQASVQTSAFTAVAGELYKLDCTSAGFNVTLPASPTEGDEVFFRFVNGSDPSANNVTFLRNGSEIENETTDLVWDVASPLYFSLLYLTEDGWTTRL